MNSITFIDLETDAKSGKILDIGGIKESGSTFHSNSIFEFTKFLNGSDFICGHNIINHDLKYLGNVISAAEVKDSGFIDTLFLSPMLFPTKPYHKLLKDDKLQTDELNNPLNDSIKARDLFFDEITAFKKLDNAMKRIYLFLLRDQQGFQPFFEFVRFGSEAPSVESDIREQFHLKICENANLPLLISNHPIELAYCLALINANNRYSITPPWVLKNFPKVETIMFLLRNNPCLTGCEYCAESLDVHKGLQRFFGFDSFRTYAGEPLQEKAVKAAVDNKSLLAVFPTGGGKSITFQVPALMSGINTKSLTVIISPLQSLMKDQVDNLERAGIIDAVTINGLLDPIERAKSIERVDDGSASILYISPESLRSRTIEKLILNRNIARFVIDEAHCFSSWGQDFRVDYLYIGDFIKSIQEKKNLETGIPVSCFTATAKPKVIEDIQNYFKEKLSLDLKLFNSDASRTNLKYIVLEKESEDEKYITIRNLLDEKNCPTIIYVSRTNKAKDLALRLEKDGFHAKAYHGKMEKQEKSDNQDAFIRGDIQIMVATSAFGMGVDKKDVGMVIHYDISDSLENYIQEAGRAGRDEAITADCYVLFNDEDLSKHFILLNQTKLSIKEIQQVWKAIKELTRFRTHVSQSALEIARKAGWDDNVNDIETRVKTAIAALENAGYVKRSQNVPRIYADSIISKNAQEAISKIDASALFTEKEKVTATRIIKNLISNKSRKAASGEEAESRIDYMSDILGIEKEEIVHIVNILREENILAFTKDLSAYIKKKENVNRSIEMLKSYWQIEKYLLTIFEREEKTFHIKELNEEAEKFGCKDSNPNKIKTIINFWAIKNWIKQHRNDKDHVTVISLFNDKDLEAKLNKRHELAKFIMEYFNQIPGSNSSGNESGREEVMVEFSENDIKEAFEKQISLINTKTSIEDIEDALFYLSRIEALKIEGGFLVIYNGITIDRIEQDNKIKYKAEDYKELNQFYENKVQQIHIVGEYAKKMIIDYKDAIRFVDDYFKLNYSSFINKYFKGSRENEIRQNITPKKFKQLFGELSTVQLNIIKDNETKYVVVAAGPGSGKTRVLVHKLASLLLMEDVKHEQMLMVTFSRAATTEFKKRLQTLIGNAANFIEIKTFHSYCFDLLGRIGSIEKSEDVIKETVRRIRDNEVEIGRITKNVIVIDEAQDMDADEFDLIIALIEKNEDMRVIAVGDDDQNIYEFRGSSSKHLERFIKSKNAVVHELIENYRSKRNLVEFSNSFVNKISHRLKQTPIHAVQSDLGNIKIVKYKSPNLITPLVNDILKEEITGSTCVLTTKNEEALQIAGLLSNQGLPAKLIQSNDGFRLCNLLEIRFFVDLFKTDEHTHMISDDDWAEAKRKLKVEFSGGSKTNMNLEICNNIIKDFESTHPKNKYKTDLDIFINESKLEDFYDEKIETIYVSTIHKAKGREFDNVYVMLDNFNPASDEAKRQLYVAMTRAKRNLIIHYNGNYLDFIKTDDLQIVEDPAAYSPPSILTIMLSFQDVWLDAFIACQNLISQLSTGDEITVDKDCCRTAKDQIVLRFSKLFISQIEALKQKGYEPQKAIIKFIVYWIKEDTEKEVRVVFPEVWFERKDVKLVDE
ncbi:MAG: RecQ family ATP-dependent DNA helicase [Saccharofermentanales bacterium]